MHKDFEILLMTEEENVRKHQCPKNRKDEVYRGTSFGEMYLSIHKYVLSLVCRALAGPTRQ